jgi:hypothetical protein
MPRAAIIEIDRTTRQASFLADLDLASIPTKEDKIVFDIKGIGFVLGVIDVHHADNQRVDVNLIRISTITDYNPRRSGN